MNRIAIIGGGASGMCAAIAAASQGAEVTLYEGNDRVGKKILSTGNGKCNFTNLEMDKSFYRTGEEEGCKLIDSVLKEFDTSDTIAFFEQMGLMIKQKGSLLYPASEQAAVVLDLLRYELKREKVKIHTEEKISRLDFDDKSHIFTIQVKEGKAIFDKVILCCGSKAAPKTGSDGSGYELARSFGHRIVPVVPALVQLRCREEGLKAVMGVRTEASVTLRILGREDLTERGELQLTDYGISGIVVFQLSRYAAYALKDKKKVMVHIDCLPDYSKEAYQLFIAARKLLATEHMTVEEFFTGMLHKKLMQLFITKAGLKLEDKIEKVSSSDLDQVFSLCKNWDIEVTGTNSFEQAQICAGGVSLLELDSTMESRIRRGLYFAGEILDVDGICGGYNLQWAWSSGTVAGIHAAKS